MRYPSASSPTRRRVPSRLCGTHTAYPPRSRPAFRREKLHLHPTGLLNLFLSACYHAFVQLAYRLHVPDRIDHFDPEYRDSLEVLVDVPLVFECAAHQQPLIYGLFLLPPPLPHLRTLQASHFRSVAIGLVVCALFSPPSIRQAKEVPASYGYGNCPRTSQWGFMVLRNLNQPYNGSFVSMLNGTSFQCILKACDTSGENRRLFLIDSLVLWV